MTDTADNRFVDAAACGDLDEVKVLLAATEPSLAAEAINKPDKDGKNAFHYACLNDDANLLRILLADHRVNVSQTSRNGDTGLHMASLYAALEAISLLVADGRMDINAQNKYGETPLHLCAGSGDKSAAKTAKVLLSHGASLTVVDKWKRGPLDVSHDNAENPIVATFNEYLTDRSRCSEEIQAAVSAVSAAYKAETARQNAPLSQADEDIQVAKSKAAAISLFGGKGGLGGLGGIGGGLAGIKLKKTNTVIKTMFKVGEGEVHAGVRGKVNTDTRRALSKLIDFPGDLEEIRMHLENHQEDPVGINPAGADAFGLTALHKFASWNKTDYLELLIPRLSKEELEVRDPEGKTALHYAVEMASVAAVKALVAAGVDTSARDGKGRTVEEILDNAPSSGVIDRLKSALFVHTA